jgi:predicted DNA-binding transcriptional regulator YafY
MFSTEEIEALVLGSRWVARRADDASLGAAASAALSKITAVLPMELRAEVDAATLLVGPSSATAHGIDIALVRHAIRAEHKLVIAYRSAGDTRTERTIWPFAIGFFEQARVIVAWCELRQEIRHFRADRVLLLTVTDLRYPRPRQSLLRDWRRQQGIDTPAGN